MNRADLTDAKQNSIESPTIRKALSTSCLFRSEDGVRLIAMNPHCHAVQRSPAAERRDVVRVRDVVLVADDDPRVRRVLVTLLRQVGFAVIDAAKGQ